MVLTSGRQDDNPPQAILREAFSLLRKATIVNPSKRKGTAFETLVVRWLQDNGFPFAERRALAGSYDKGDIAGVPGIALECKATKAFTPSEFVDEANIEAHNAGVPTGVAIVKRRGKGAGDAYVLMDLETFVELIR